MSTIVGITAFSGRNAQGTIFPLNTKAGDMITGVVQISPTLNTLPNAFGTFVAADGVGVQLDGNDLSGKVFIGLIVRP
jgi:hypothetical protein